jgi:predicted site-specific integrase-resolvase
LVVIEGHQTLDAGVEDEDGYWRAAVYCRVSSHEQKAKGDLDRQVAIATRHCMKVGLGKPVVFTDVGSGLNATRPGLARLCKQVESGQVKTVVVSFKDRLTRFGFEYLRRYFTSHGTSIIVARKPATQSMQDELVEDLIAIVTSFSGRVHGMRGVHEKHAGKKIDPDDKAAAKAVSDAVDVAVDDAVRKIIVLSEIPRSGTT